MTTVVMAHGAFCAGWAFERFRTPFEAEGWRVLAPDLPGHGPGQAVAGLSMRDYAEAVARVCAAEPEPVILVGHSMGGLVCQMAAARARPKALVLLATSSPWGVAGSTVEEAITALGVTFSDPFWTGAVDPDLSLVRHHSLDRVPHAEREAIAARMVPESGRALREVLNWWLDPFMTTSVSGVPCPTLVIAGGRDQVHPPATVRQTAQRLGAAFDLKPQMSHWLIGEPGWDHVAADVIAWLNTQLRAAA